MIARPRVCFVVSSAMTVQAFLTTHIEALSADYEVHVVLDADAQLPEPRPPSITAVHRARIRRNISPLADILGVLELARIFRRERYAAVHSISPKAGLLAALAGFVARVPVRIHTYTGQVWATRNGFWRVALRALDSLIARLDTHVLADSASQLEFLRNNRVLKPGQGEVLASGSICGVDPSRFKPDAAMRESARRELDIPAAATVFLFLARMNRDKGILDLARAFGEVAANRDDLHLLCVGPDEDALTPQVRAACGTAAARLRFVDWTSTPERYIAAADIACMPSYREGFGAVVIEAAAAGVPAIGSRIYGVVDAIRENETGLLVAAGDVAALADAMRTLAENTALRGRLGDAARVRALRDFSNETVTRAMVDYYRRVVAVSGAGAVATLSTHG